MRPYEHKGFLIPPFCEMLKNVDPAGARGGRGVPLARARGGHAWPVCMFLDGAADAPAALNLSEIIGAI